LVAMYEILHHFVSMSVSFLRYTVGCMRGTSG
jgi:hypothetical protein